MPKGDVLWDSIGVSLKPHTVKPHVQQPPRVLRTTPPPSGCSVVCYDTLVLAEEQRWGGKQKWSLKQRWPASSLESRIWD